MVTKARRAHGNSTCSVSLTVPCSSTTASTVLIITAFYRRIGWREPPKWADFLGSDLAWQTKSTETRHDGTERIVYANARTQPMLEVIRTTEGGVTKQQGTYTRYNARGQAIWQVSPEAIALPANLADLEQYPDLLNEVARNFQYISDSSGLIEVTNYATATTATATLAGSADRFVSSTAVMRGDRGTAITQEAFMYFLRTRENKGKDRHNP